MNRFKLELDYKATTSNKTFKHFLTPKSMYVLKITKQLSTVEYTVIEAILDYYSMPEGNTTKTYAYSTLSNFLKMDKSNFKKIMDSLFKKGYLVKKDNSIILQVELINAQVKKYMEEHGNKALNDNTKAEKDRIILEKDKEYLKTLEKLIAAGVADENDIEKYNRLKTLLHNDDKEEDLAVKEQETITNTTKEIKAEKQPKIETTTIEVEKTQKEADLDVKKETENKDTTSIIQPLKQPETFPKHEQTEEEMIQEYLNRLIEPTKIQILSIKKYIYQYFQTKDPKNLIDLEYQMRLYEKAQNDQDSHKAYDQRHGYDDDIDNYDEDGNLNLMDGDINL